MRTLKGFLIFLCLLLLFLSGLFIFLWNVSFWGPPSLLQSWVQQVPYLTRLCLAGLFVLLPLAVLLLKERQGRRLGELRAKTAKGIVSVREGAVVKILRTVLLRLPEVLSVHALLSERRQGILVRIRAQVNISTKNLPEITEELRQEARNTLNQVLGIPEIADITVLIEDIKLPAEGIRRLKERSVMELAAESRDDTESAKEMEGIEPREDQTF